MDADALLLLASFCRLRLQARPVLFLPSGCQVLSVAAFADLWQGSQPSHGRGGGFSLFLRVLVAEVTAATAPRDQLMAAWMLCSLLTEHVAELDSFFWRCAVAQEAFCKLQLRAARQHVSCDTYCLHSSTPLLDEKVQEGKGMDLRSTFAPCAARKFGYGHVSSGSHRDRSESAAVALTYSIPLPASAEARALVCFCARMRSRRKSFRLCCIRRLDDCHSADRLKSSLSAAHLRLLVAQHSVEDSIKEACRTQGVFVIERLGRRAVDVLEEKLQATAFENYSEWRLSLASTDTVSWQSCWAAATQRSGGLLLHLHTRCHTAPRDGLTRSLVAAERKPEKNLAQVPAAAPRCRLQHVASSNRLLASLLRWHLLALVFSPSAGAGRGGLRDGERGFLDDELVAFVLGAASRLSRFLLE